MKKVHIIGAGLAGSEAAYYLANRGIKVFLYEMRPHTKSPAHHTSFFGELVCSNSLKSKNLDNACGLLKKELEILDSLVIEAAYKNEVPGGSALCVDREAFAKYIHQKITNHPLITVIHEEVREALDGITIFATGPLTSPQLLNFYKDTLGAQTLSFYDASSPIVTKDSLDLTKLVAKSRYDADEGSYLNAFLNKEQYLKFYNELINGERVILKDFEQNDLFEGCQPIEELAKKGVTNLLFGPLTPQGISNSYAVVQLRQDDFAQSLYSLVGFQSNLTYKEQKRIFSLIPGLEHAEYVRYGLMHKNSYLCSPKLLSETLSFKEYDDLYVCGQLSGVEGYVESAMSGLITAMVVYQKLTSQTVILPPKESMCGSLIRYIIYANPQHFRPMSAVFNLIQGYTKKEKPSIIARAISSITNWKENINE